MIAKCALCNGEVIRTIGTFPFKTKNLGIVEVPNIEFEKCTNCKDQTLSVESSQAIHDYVLNEEQKRIGRLPIDDFITVQEAIDILGISKQAFSKHPRIKRGFIYGVTKGNRTLYHKKSVFLFRDTKDGRFKLNNPNANKWKDNKLRLVVDNRSNWRATAGYTLDSKQLATKTPKIILEEGNGYAFEA